MIALPPLCRLIAAAALLALLSLPARAIGFSERSVADPGQPDLIVGVWYPSDAPPAPQRLGLDRQSVAQDGAVAGNALPLVLISHGTGGWYGGHADTAQALAAAGFVVAAVTHTGDNYRDTSRALQIDDRPRQIGRVLDYMLADWPAHDRIDAARIGIFGHSAGGFTALVAVGGTPDLGRVAAHCGANPDEWSCKLVREHGIDLAKAPPAPAITYYHDARIRAAVVAAPALGYTFGPAGLAAITVPIQLWRAAEDAILPNPWYAQMVRDDLPSPPEYHVVPNAGHFAFLAPCSAALAQAVPDICADPPGFDRAAFHRQFDAAVVAFFESHL